MLDYLWKSREVEQGGWGDLSSKFKRIVLSLFIPVIVLAITACPGLIIDNISVSFDSSGAIVGATVTFSCFSPVANDIITYQWSFGDGTTTEGKTVTHVYAANGKFIVECRVVTTDSVLIFTKEIQIRPVPIPFDSFTDAQSSGPKACSTGFSQNSVAITDGAFQSRLLRTGGIGLGVHTISVSGGTLVFDATDACAIMGLILFDGTSSPFDASEFSRIVIPVLSTTGSTITCDINVFNNGIRIFRQFDVPMSSSIMIDISKDPRDSVDELSIGQCDVAAAGSFTLGPPEFR
jgi:PKD repeat protein